MKKKGDKRKNCLPLKHSVYVLLLHNVWTGTHSLIQLTVQIGLPIYRGSPKISSSHKNSLS